MHAKNFFSLILPMWKLMIKKHFQYFWQATGVHNSYCVMLDRELQSSHFFFLYTFDSAPVVLQLYICICKLVRATDRTHDQMKTVYIQIAPSIFVGNVNNFVGIDMEQKRTLKFFLNHLCDVSMLTSLQLLRAHSSQTGQVCKRK